MSSPVAELPAVRAARTYREELARWEAEQREREAGRVPPDLLAAALAFGGWQLTLAIELGRSPTPEEQAEWFDHLAGALSAAVERHALPDFWDMLPTDPFGKALRILLEPPRKNFRRHILKLLNGDPQAFGPTLIYQPTQLRWLAEDHFTLRRLPEVLTLGELQDWLSEAKLSDGGRARLATMRPEVGTLRDVLNVMGKSLPRFEFTPRGIDALVDECFVPVHKGTREEYLALPVVQVLERIEKGPPPKASDIPVAADTSGTLERFPFGCSGWIPGGVSGPPRGAWRQQCRRHAPRGGPTATPNREPL